MGDGLGWQEDLQAWLAPFLERLLHPAPQRMCSLYVTGLIAPGERKSIQLMAQRLGLPTHDSLHHFIAQGCWDRTPLEAALWQEAKHLVGGERAVLIIDDTALPKKGRSSVGVAPQYATSLGKRANCQTLVSLTLAQGEVPVPVALRLFLPESWTSDPDRLDKAGVPETARPFRTKPEIALAEIDRVLAQGLAFGVVLSDAGYGLSASFRKGLSERGPLWAVGIPKHQKVYPADIAMIFPQARRGRPRLRCVPETDSLAAEKMLSRARWRRITWRQGTKGHLSAAFAAVRARVADGPTQRIRALGAQHQPGEELWLIGERRASGEHKYYLANLAETTDLRTLTSSLKARWTCEQAHQQLKEELGLDHFEGRSWESLHRHALLTLIAFAFLQHQRLRQAKRKKSQAVCHPPRACPPSVRPSSVTCSCSGRQTHARSAATVPLSHPNGVVPK